MGKANEFISFYDTRRNGWMEVTNDRLSGDVSIDDIVKGWDIICKKLGITETTLHSYEIIPNDYGATWAVLYGKFGAIDLSYVVIYTRETVYLRSSDYCQQEEDIQLGADDLLQLHYAGIDVKIPYEEKSKLCILPWQPLIRDASHLFDTEQLVKFVADQVKHDGILPMPYVALAYFTSYTYEDGSISFYIYFTENNRIKRIQFLRYNGEVYIDRGFLFLQSLPENATLLV